jgi:hypothetical protein
VPSSIDYGFTVLKPVNIEVDITGSSLLPRRPITEVRSSLVLEYYASTMLRSQDRIIQNGMFGEPTCSLE